MSNQPASRETFIHQIHRWAIEHSRAVIAIYALLMICAVYAAVSVIPRRFAPYIKSPLLAVVTSDMGASPSVIELKITNPVEEILQSVPGFRYIRSTSQDGMSTVTLEFPYGTDMAAKERQVQALIPAIEGRLPTDEPNLMPPYVTLADPLNLPILILAISPKPGTGSTLASVRRFCDNELQNRLKDIPDVASVDVFGGYRRQLQVKVDLRRLSSLGLSISDVAKAIDGGSLFASGGSLIEGPSEIITTSDDRRLLPAEIADIPLVSKGKPPLTVRLGSVAKVTDGFWQTRSAYAALLHPPGQAARIIPAIEVAVTQDPGASSAEVVPKIRAELQRLQVQRPDFQYKVAYDNSHFVNILFNNVWEELGSAIILTGIAILLFLGDPKAAAISLFTLPTSLGLAVLTMVPFHFSFNSGTLIGLLLAVGRLVDDTIIDVHNVQRWIGMGHSRRDATIAGIGEVRTAVISSTAMIIIALVPLPFAGGLVGQMFYQLVWPLIFGLLASMVVSFTLTPILTDRFLSDGPEFHRRLWGLAPIQDWLERLEGGYRRSVFWCLRHRFIIFMGVVSVVTIGLTFYTFLGSEMMPLSDTGSASARIEMAPGSSFADLARGVEQIEAIIARYPEVERASVEMGQEPQTESWNPSITGYQMPQSNDAAMMLTLSDKDARSRTIWSVIDAIQREAMATVPGLRRFQIKEMGSDVMASPDSPVTIDAYGPRFDSLDQIGAGMMRVANAMPDELYQPARSWVMGQPEYRVHVDPVLASQFGVTAQSVIGQLSAATFGIISPRGVLNDDLRPDSIVVRASRDQRQSLSDLKRIAILNGTGQAVPLDSLATVSWMRSPTMIQHDGLRRVVQLSAFYRIGHAPSMTAIMDWVRNSFGGIPAQGIKPVNYPPGYGILVRGDMTQMMESVARLLRALGISLVLMYFVLVIQFRGFLKPVKMIASLPLELTGVFVALWLAHESFSTVALLGIIVLTGMDMTAAVLMIDVVSTATDSTTAKLPQGAEDQGQNELGTNAGVLSGKAKEQLTADACSVRLRPILMTTILTLIVLIPVAMHPKTGLDAYQPLAVAVVGGLIVGTVLSLYVIPVLHSMIDEAIVGLDCFARRVFRHKEPCSVVGSDDIGGQG